MKARFLSNHS